MLDFGSHPNSFLINYVNLDMFLSLSRPQFPYLLDEVKNEAHTTGAFED